MNDIGAYENICLGDSVTIQICNTGTADADITIEYCTGISGDTDEATVPACGCIDVVITFDSVDFGLGSCNIKICGDIQEIVKLTWNRVYCPLSRTGFEFKPLADIAGESNPFVITSLNEDCSALNMGCISEPRQATLSYSIVDDIEVGDEIFFSLWAFARRLGWNIDGVPDAGWMLKVCETPDGEYPLTFYGDENSDDLTWFQGINPTITFSDAKTFSIVLKYNNPASMTTPVNNDIRQVHDFWLKDNLKATTELTTDSGNSPYDGQSEMGFVCMVVRGRDGSIQDDFFTVPVKLNFYGENQFDDQILTITEMAFTVPADSADTSFFCTQRNTDVHLEFDITNLTTPGTLPEGSVLMLIDVTARNNFKRPADNYDLSQADITNGVTGQRIITITNNITYSGSGDSFYCDFTVDNTFDAESNYRLILITYHVTEEIILAAISSEIGVATVSDELLDFSDNAATTFISLEKEFTSAETNLLAAVNMPWETRFTVDLSELDSQVSAKTGGQITTALAALKSIDLFIYTRSAMTGTLDLITQYYKASLTNICGVLTATAGEFLNYSDGSSIDLRFQFETLSNGLRVSGRDNLFQTDTDGLQYSSLAASNLVCAANAGVNCAAIGLNKLQDIEIGTSDSLYRAAYISQLDEFWICDGTVGADCIQRINATTFEQLTPISLTVGDNPTDILYMLDYDKAYISCFGTNKVRIITISTQTVSSSITITPIRSFKLCRSNNGITDYCYATSSSSNISVIDISSDTETTVLNDNSNSSTPVFIPDINSGDGEIWITDDVNNRIARYDRSDNSFIAYISTGALPTYEIIYVPGNLSIPDKAFVAAGTDMISIETDSLTLTTKTFASQIWHLVFDINTRTLLFTDSSTNNLYSADADLLELNGTYIAVDGANDLVLDQTGNYLVVVGFGANEVSVFTKAKCEPGLPNFDWAGKNIIFEWRLNFDYGE